jgi:hypothetical protein
MEILKQILHIVFQFFLAHVTESHRKGNTRHSLLREFEMRATEVTPRTRNIILKYKMACKIISRLLADVCTAVAVRRVKMRGG